MATIFFFSYALDSDGGSTLALGQIAINASVSVIFELK
jgi:hypothetical protein